MDLRNSYYCVSVPGESQWVKEQNSSVDKKLELALEGTNDRHALLVQGLSRVDLRSD